MVRICLRRDFRNFSYCMVWHMDILGLVDGVTSFVVKVMVCPRMIMRMQLTFLVHLRLIRYSLISLSINNLKRSNKFSGILEKCVKGISKPLKYMSYSNLAANLVWNVRFKLCQVWISVLRCAWILGFEISSL